MKKIFDFEKKLVPLILTQRPSKSIRSPYVADGTNLKGEKCLVHVPSLDLAGQCLNGSKILATPSKVNSKTDYIAQAVCYKDFDKKEVIIGANPYTAELICKHLIRNNIWNPFKGWDLISRPKNLDYKADLYFGKNKNYNIIEIKNVVCASYDPKIDKYDQKTKFHDYKTPFLRAGVYPFGKVNQLYKGKRVVSERSIRQIDFMKKHKDKYNFFIIFLVNRGDCEVFKPCWKADPLYAKALLTAQQCGIILLAIRIKWTLSGCYFDKELVIDLEKW
tara:strand:+ start:776 stop:1603 length:828 start_codon:yes stop_codon:yes gene_type:complete